MKKLLLLILLLAACQSQPADTLPTLAVLDGETTTDPNAATAIPPTLPPTAITPVITFTPSQTSVPVTSAVTATFVNPPSFATQEAQTLADVIITENEYQREINQRIAEMTSIDRALIDFVPEGLRVQLSAQGGAALIAADVLVLFDVRDGFVQISIGDIRLNAAEPPPALLEVIGGDFITVIVDSLDALLEARLGAEHDLETLIFTENRMEITLLVPDR